MQPNLNYVTLSELMANETDSEEHATMKMVTILMLATGVARLYTEDDFRVFFKRLALIAGSYNILDRFFVEGELLTYIDKNGIHDLTTGDISKCIGFQLGASYRDHVTDENWMDDIRKIINNAIVAGFFSGIFIFMNDRTISGEIQDGKTSVQMKLKTSKIELSKTDIKNATILAESMLRELPENMFAEWEAQFPDAIPEFNRMKLLKSTIKIFDYEGLPPETKVKIRKHFEQFFSPDKYDEFKVYKLTYLAWAYANNHILVDEMGLHFVDEIYEFDETGLEFPDGGTNLQETFFYYSLNDLWNDLKGK